MGFGKRDTKSGCQNDADGVASSCHIHLDRRTKYMRAEKIFAIDFTL